MLTVNYLRTHLATAKKRLQKRGYDEQQLSVLDQIISLDDRRKALQTDMDQLLSEQKKLAAEIGSLFKSGKVDEANAMKANVASKKKQAKVFEDDLKETQDGLRLALLDVPNLPNDQVPSGLTEDDNELIKSSTSDLPDLGSSAKPHWELADQYQLIDFKLGAKITGSGFPLYMGKGARLERALINFFLDQATAAGYREILPPLLVNQASGLGTGNLPDKDGQMYYCEKDDLYLIPTAEVPITNMYRDVLLKEADFPIKLTGYTPCFRREAGSYGSDVKGLNRVHQFNKVEIVQIVHPDQSYAVLDEMVAHVESILEKLELPYRILRLCGGDLSFSSALTYDFEVYSAAQQKWLEVSSVSNFESFQSNRMRLRFKNASGKSTLAHTLNGSALALARIVACLLENNQTDDGIKIPEALRPYTGFDIIN